MSYILSLQNMYPFRDIFTIIKKKAISVIPTVAIIESEMSLHGGQAKKLLRRQVIIAKMTLERAHSRAHSPPSLERSVVREPK